MRIFFLLTFLSIGGFAQNKTDTGEAVLFGESKTCKEYVTIQHFFKSRIQKEIFEDIFSPQFIASCFRKYPCGQQRDLINRKDTTYYFSEGFVDISYQEDHSDDVFNKLLLKLKNNDPNLRKLFNSSVIVCLFKEKPKLRLIFIDDCDSQTKFQQVKNRLKEGDRYQKIFGVSCKEGSFFEL